MTVKEQIKPSIIRHYTCPNLECTWYRDLTTDEKMLATRLFVPGLGTFTYRTLAEYDVKQHNCQHHTLSRLRMKWVINRAA